MRQRFLLDVSKTVRYRLKLKACYMSSSH